MGLSIKNLETERLARQVAEEAGETITEAIDKSLRERLERLNRRKGSQAKRDKVDEILRRIHALPILDPRTPDEILDYDENGMPR
jgi:antitoxin VapB